MAEFTYQSPDRNQFMRALLRLLEVKGEGELARSLRGATCVFNVSGTFSRQRWNAFWTEVIFHVVPERLDNLSQEAERALVGYCDALMPKEAGLDVMHVAIVPSLNATATQHDIEKDIRDISEAVADSMFKLELPDDLLAKGREMAEVYGYLYCVENILRVFIEQSAVAAFGEDYMSQISVPRSVKEGIAIRKRNEQRNKWLSVRGTSDLFYLDFKELADIITNNWKLFSSYFPDQAWIRMKIEEMADCRNLIAHNSYVDGHERNVIRLNFMSIIRQLRGGSEQT